MSEGVDLVVAPFAAAVLAIGLLSRLLERNALSPALLAMLTGVAVGPQVLGWVDLTAALPMEVLLEEVTRFALALAVAEVGLQVSRRDLRRNARRVLVLLTVGMVGMWADYRDRCGAAARAAGGRGSGAPGAQDREGEADNVGTCRARFCSVRC